jgi:hypothetical protein
MSEELHHGRCLCGDIRFVAQGAPTLTAWCHCASCRRHSGAPVAAFADYRRGQVRFLGAQPVRFQSSSGVWRGFCGRCGSTLSFESDEVADEISLHVGAFDHPERFAPVAVSHAGERLPWIPRGFVVPAEEPGGNSAYDPPI